MAGWSDVLYRRPRTDFSLCVSVTIRTLHKDPAHSRFTLLERPGREDQSARSQVGLGTTRRELGGVLGGAVADHGRRPWLQPRLYWPELRSARRAVATIPPPVVWRSRSQSWARQCGGANGAQRFAKKSRARGASPAVDGRDVVRRVCPTSHEDSLVRIGLVPRGRSRHVPVRAAKLVLAVCAREPLEDGELRCGCSI